MALSTKSTFRYCVTLVCCLILSVESQARPTETTQARARNAFAPASPREPAENRVKRQLILPGLQSLRPRLLPRLPPPQPLLLPLITSALSDGIRTYPYYLQEIPLAFGETILGSMREVGPHISEALRDISPGIVEMMNVIPETEKLGPIQRMMKKIPAVLQETMQETLDPPEWEDTAEDSLESQLYLTNLRPRQIKPLKILEDTFLNTKEKFNSKFEQTKQKAHALYQNLIQDYEPAKKYKPQKKKAPSNMATPLINSSLTEMAKIPKKIKSFVEHMKE